MLDIRLLSLFYLFWYFPNLQILPEIGNKSKDPKDNNFQQYPKN
jgi:hypothetical protein